jgi:TolA-binding protein
MSLRRNISCLVVGSMMFMLCARAFAVSQEELAEMSASGLLTEATKILSAENYGLAIPYLSEYLERMKDTEDDRVLALMQEVRLKLGKISAYLENPLGAVDYLKQYTEKLPVYKPREAYKLLAVNLYEVGRYEECITAASYALTRPLPKDLPKKGAVNYEKLSKDEKGGFTDRQIKRYEKYAKELEADLSAGFSEKAPDLEPDYTVEELVLLNMTLAEASTTLEQWAATLVPYQFVIDNATDESRKGYAILQMVNSLIALERFKEAGAFVMKLSRTNARYDIRVNMALMKAATALSMAGELDSALMLYRMVLPREELVAYQEGKMNEMRRDAGLPDVEVKIVTNELGRVETLFGNKKSGFSLQSSSSQATEGAILPPKPMELIKLEELAMTLISLPPYENDVLYRTGALYAESGRPWEAVATLSILATRDPDGELGQRAFAESLQVLVNPLKEYERVETLATKFLESHTEGLGPRMVAHALTGCYQKQERWKDIKPLLPVIEGFVPLEDKIIRQYECELYYMQAIADLMLFNYSQALADFDRVLTDFPGSHQRENATHWHAMSQLFLKNYVDALAEFTVYRADYPDGTWMPEAIFHSGVCLFGLERNAEAQKQFTEVISNYPESSVYSDACSLRGDILASQGLLDEAQRDYEEAIASARNVKQDTYAVFQMVAMFELEKRYQKMIDAVQAYLDRRGEEGDVAKAAYWIGKTKLAQGLIDEAVETYRETIVKYGGTVLQDGVDLIIEELTQTAKRLKDEPRHQLEERLRADANAAENQTLKLRLQVLMAKMDGTELELGKKLIAEQSDLTQAPPPVLAVICNASFAAGDYSRAQEILTIFQNHFEDSDFMRAAYKLRGYDLFLAGDLDGAMKIIAEAQSLYGTQTDAAWAQLMKGRIELQQEEFDTARTTFRDLLNVREWRGEPYAEATYYLGEVEEKAGDRRKAFGWYQRTYFQYKGYAKGKWAAEGYLASARCLQKLGLENDRRNTYRAMLFDKYVNQLPQADEAKAVLGPDEVLKITTLLEQGVQTNLVVTLEAEGAL